MSVCYDSPAKASKSTGLELVFVCIFYAATQGQIIRIGYFPIFILQVVTVLSLSLPSPLPLFQLPLPLPLFITGNYMYRCLHVVWMNYLHLSKQPPPRTVPTYTGTATTAASASAATTATVTATTATAASCILLISPVWLFLAFPCAQYRKPQWESLQALPAWAQVSTFALYWHEHAPLVLWPTRPWSNWQ